MSSGAIDHLMVVDLETTGLSLEAIYDYERTAAIIEIAAVPFILRWYSKELHISQLKDPDTGKAMEFNTLIWVDEDQWSTAAEAIHHISYSDLENAPNQLSALHNFADFYRHANELARRKFRIASYTLFDVELLVRDFQRKSALLGAMPFSDKYAVDLQQLIQTLGLMAGHPRRQTLQAYANICQLGDEAHRALQDVKLTMMAIQCLHKQIFTGGTDLNLF